MASSTRWRRLLAALLGGVLLLVAVSMVAWSIWPPAQLARGAGGYLDNHVHVAGLGILGEGAFVSAEMHDNFRFEFLMDAMQVTEAELGELGDGVLVDRLVERIRESSEVSQAVILAMDGVINEAGELDLDRTTIYVPNDYVAAQSARYPELVFGASINPYRPDALQRLDRVAEQGAVLIKWIPSIMYIDPADPAIAPFYQRMVELDLKLLTHVGQEKSFPGAIDELGDPHKIELPLQLGVKVIAAHIGTTGEYAGEPSFDRLIPMFEQWPNLYADISSLTQINKLGYLATSVELGNFNDRLIYGSDWPLQFFPLVHPLYHWPDLSIAEARAIANIDSIWDRDIAIKRALGVDEAVFERSAQLLLRRQ